MATVLNVPRELLITLVALGIVISITVVPGVFIADDNNYLINVLTLREHRVTVANTEGLPPSPELLFFDPGPWAREVYSTPVASTAPPLYALIALPFSSIGWRGLIGLNTLAFLTTILIVFVYAQRYSAQRSTPWLGAFAVALGGYFFDYAQGLWPHALSVALCTGAVFCTSRLLEGSRVVNASAAGLLLGVATGVRYQNFALLLAIAGAIVLWSWRRPRAIIAFALAAAIPLLLSSFINHARLDSWNPISKGKGYLSVPLAQDSTSAWSDPLVMLWAQVVDYSVRPRLTATDTDWDHYDETTGTHLMLGVTPKKALLQSAPWSILGLLLFGLAWLPWWKMRPDIRRQLRLLSLPTLALLAVFTFAGTARHDGLAFNQRYLLELLPLAAIGFAWSLDTLVVRLRLVLIGGAVGAALVLAILLRTPVVGGPESPFWVLRLLLLQKLPLLLAAALALLWILHRRGHGVQELVGGVAGLCLGWGLTLHLADDLAAANRVRAAKLARTEILATHLPERSALLAYRGYKDAAGPLLFARDIVILDVRADEGRDAPLLVRELLNRGRRVFLLEDGFPADVLLRVISGRKFTALDSEGLPLIELLSSFENESARVPADSRGAHVLAPAQSAPTIDTRRAAAARLTAPVQGHF